MAVAWAVVGAILALVVGAVIVWDLTGVRSHSGERPGRLRETLAIFRHRFVEALPMASVKILVVIWQIVTQVRTQCMLCEDCRVHVEERLFLCLVGTSGLKDAGNFDAAA